MPHRHQEAIALCAECRAPAVESCERCNRPLCSAHKMKPESRCDACEARFLEIAPVYLPSKALQVGSSVIASTGLLATFAVGALVVTQNLAAWSLVALVAGLTGLYGVRGVLNNKEAAQVQRAREEFLLEGPGDIAKQLPARSLGGGQEPEG